MPLPRHSRRVAPAHSPANSVPGLNSIRPAQTMTPAASAAKTRMSPGAAAISLITSLARPMQTVSGSPGTKPAAASRPRQAGRLIIGPRLPLDGLPAGREAVALPGDQPVQVRAAHAHVAWRADEPLVTADHPHYRAVPFVPYPPRQVR